MKLPQILSVIGLVFLFCSTPTHLASQNTAATIDFDRDVHTIIASKCLTCHSEEKRSGGLSLASYQDVLDGGRSGAAVRPGNSAGSLIIARISGATAPQMPFGLPPLSEAEINTIRYWIDQGARATPTSAPARGKWEAPLSLDKPSVPETTWRTWTSPVDRFVSAYLKKDGVAEPETVLDSVFARRAWLDIQGLLPTPEDLQKFLDDKSPEKREALVAKLLADNQKYSENWISYWNDLLRNDEGVNYYSETAGRQSISTWLLEALQSNLHYDEMVKRLLNPSSQGDPEGFLQGVNWRGTVNASQTPAMQAAQNTAQIFLGINLKCNSCHDSFISKWKLKDAYSLASYFSTDEKLELYRCDVAQHQYAQASFLYPELNHAPKSDSMDDRRAAAAAIFTDPKNGRMPRTIVNRMWLKLMGRGVVENPDEMDGEPWNPQLLDWLASDFVENQYDLKHLIATILNSKTYQMATVAQKGEQPREYSFRGPLVRRLTAEQFSDAIGSITGNWPLYQRGPTLVATRDWRVAASPLARALGRPIRDQVYTTRDTQATTLQALELINGETLTHRLLRGAQTMLGERGAAPASLFDAPFSTRAPSAFDIDVSKVDKLWLLVEDTGSYSPEKLETIWGKAGFDGPNGRTDLSELKPIVDSGLRATTGADGVTVKTPSRLVYDISGKGFRRFYGLAGIENKVITSDLSPKLRFFIFDKDPDMERLTPISKDMPIPSGPTPKTAPEVVDRVFRYALGRAPSDAEMKTAENAIRTNGKISAEGVADLLWAVLMKPEFQLIY